MSDPFVAAAARGLAALSPPARLLLAVSGGADSVALLDALFRGLRRSDLQALEFTVGHFDHGLRPDSGEDLRLVEELAREHNLRFVSRRETVQAPPGWSLEHAAREQRYEALVSMANEAGCGAIVTAHTATDQAETLLWRLVRGAGTRGLGGMRGSRALGPLRLLRPLLGVSREETRGYCQRAGLRFHDDPTNENARPRARLRAEVLPVLERLQPGAVFRLADAAARLQEDEAFLEASLDEAEISRGEVLYLASLPTPLRRRALMRWAAARLGTRLRLGAAHIHGLDRLVSTGRGEVELPANAVTHCVARVECGVLVLSERPRVKE